MYFYVYSYSWALALSTAMSLCPPFPKTLQSELWVCCPPYFFQFFLKLAFHHAAMQSLGITPAPALHLLFTAPSKKGVSDPQIRITALCIDIIQFHYTSRVTKLWNDRVVLEGISGGHLVQPPTHYRILFSAFCLCYSLLYHSELFKRVQSLINKKIQI